MGAFSDISESMRCTVGVGRADITPPVGVSLAGYFHDRVSRSVRDPLSARAVVLQFGGRRLSVVSCDLVCISPELGAKAKDAIRRRTGIPPEWVLICATHTHTGPEVRSGVPVPRDEGYVATLPDRIADAVDHAVANTAACTLHVGGIEIEGYSHNRLFRLKDGSEVFGKRPGEQYGDEQLIVDTAGPVDTQLLTLCARDEHGDVRSLLVNFALHPDVIGGGTADFISADWPGILADAVESVYGPSCGCLFLQGASGDVNHVPHGATHLPSGGPWKATQIGRALAGAAMAAAERAEPMASVELAAALEPLQVPYYTRTKELRAEVEAIRRRGPSGDFEQFLVERIDSWPYDGKLCQVPLHTIRIGEAAFFGFPAELFTRIGLDLKHYSPAGSDRTFVVELANSRVTNYVPTTDQAERGAYGAKPILSRWLCADAGRRMSDEALRRMHAMWNQPPASPP